MSRKYGKRILTTLLAAVILMTGCSAVPGADPAQTEAQTEVPEVTEPAGPSYQVE